MTRAIAGFQDQCLKPLGHTSQRAHDSTISPARRGLVHFRHRQIGRDGARHLIHAESHKKNGVDFAIYLVETFAPICGLYLVL
jgi:hypothetical protein